MANHFLQSTEVNWGTRCGTSLAQYIVVLDKVRVANIPSSTVSYVSQIGGGLHNWTVIVSIIMASSFSYVSLRRTMEI